MNTKEKKQAQGKGLDTSQMEKDLCGTQINTHKEDNTSAKFHFEISLLKGIKIDTQGLQKKDVIEIIKSIFSPKRPIFWLILSQVAALIYLVIRNAELIINAIKNPP